MSFASMSSNREEQNKELVRQLWDDVNAGNLALLEEHPGLAEIIPTVTALQRVLADAGSDTQELLADGDWVAMREIMWGTPQEDLLGARAGERTHLEAIGMYRVRDGKIVEQRSQIGPHDHPHPDEPGTNVPKRAGMAQKEANKATVRGVLGKAAAGQSDALAAHPGLGSLPGALAHLRDGRQDAAVEVKEVLADGDWVVARMVAGGADGSREAIGMFRVADGKVVHYRMQAGAGG